MRGSENCDSSPPGSPSAADWQPMDTIEPHQVARVAHVDGSIDEVRRLQAMGLCLGREVQLIKRGDPLIVRVMGTRIGVSRRLAQRVFVERCR